MFCTSTFVGRALCTPLLNADMIRNKKRTFKKHNANGVVYDEDNYLFNFEAAKSYYAINYCLVFARLPEVHVAAVAIHILWGFFTMFF